MTDIDLSFPTSNDKPSALSSINEDLDIFSGGRDTKPDSNYIPKISEVETNVRDDSSGASFTSKFTNFLGLNVDAEPMSINLKSNIDEVRNGVPRTGSTDYPKLNSASARTTIPVQSAKRKVFSKRHLLEKIDFYVRKLNEIRETKTSSEITTHSSLDEIRSEYEELRDEYCMVTTIHGYRSSIIEGAAYLESFGSVVNLPLNTDGLESAISLSIRECDEQFEQIYEEYGAIKVNPLVSVGLTVLSTVIKTHFLQTAMDAFGPSIADDPEINDILNKRAQEMSQKYATQSIPEMAAAIKSTPMETAQPKKSMASEYQAKESQFKSAFSFADQLVADNKNGAGGPPPPIHTKITKPPATEETAEQIKRMGSTLLAGDEDMPLRVPMKGPGASVSVSNFLESIKIPSPQPPEKKKTRGRKPANSTVSIDI